MPSFAFSPATGSELPWIEHRVQCGECGDSIAETYGVSLTTIERANEISFKDSPPAAGEKLLIPRTDGDLVFTNFVDFDQLFGHRRDVPGYAAALEEFDLRLPDIARKMKADDMVILTADHGCDPTWRGTDHTRERVPVLAFGPKITPGGHGVLETFADIGETVARHLRLAPGPHGRSFL